MQNIKGREKAKKRKYKLKENELQKQMLIGTSFWRER
jgi:hypothetical protein